AQKKVEENNFSIRKRLLEYDDTINQQREVIYIRRKRALQGDRLKSEIFDLLEEYISDVVDKYFDEIQADRIKEELLHSLLVEFPLEPEEFEALSNEGIKQRILEAAKTFYNKKEEMLGHEMMARLERYAMLSVIDRKWKEHLREMDDLKEGIGLRAYGQRDPVVEYKVEAFKLFSNMLEQIRDEVVSFSFKFFPQAAEEVQTKRRRQPRARIKETKQSAGNIGFSLPTRNVADNSGDENQETGKPQPVRVTAKVGRNDPCPCGSGKKYKYCHGR
ncbi:MAG TPA: preprotein translocase subunit SecA, partial [Ignavibacteria bacterium]|nr:preprotein translocase subunit SecA [Ignavibacteria bacterium]